MYPAVGGHSRPNQGNICPYLGAGKLVRTEPILLSASNCFIMKLIARKVAEYLNEFSTIGSSFCS